MDTFSERLDLALQTFGYPMGAVAFDFARIPNLTAPQYVELIGLFTPETKEVIE
jgi:hypothetical protein